ncbi:MAG TPA: Hpt domain-containing protein [Phenylobacterium sp.]|jgi:HPt (histidine-containing phosphotransfer) domain-containing protein|nr:Hpt domain-containing protein [Phenylobacterium sp.]
MACGADGPVDFAYLEGFIGRDTVVIREVLNLFRASADEWAARLAAEAPDWRDVAHTIKGAGRGVGAMALGDACERAEREGPAALPQLRQALAEASAAIDAYLARA